jgi:hypothetical protein
MCDHWPPCPPAESAACAAARVLSRDFVQGWSRLCNGVFVFEDTGLLRPNGQIIAPHRTVQEVP